MEFEWDIAKDAENLRKHGVSFREAMTVFGDPLELTIGEKGTTPDFPGLRLATFSGTPFAGPDPWRN
jgi:hypothetical protein